MAYLLFYFMYVRASHTGPGPGSRERRAGELTLTVYIINFGI